MSLPLADRLHADVQARTRVARLAAARSWSTIPRNGDWLASWTRELPRVATVTAAAQFSAASLADRSTLESLRSAGWSGDLTDLLDPRAFAGWMEPDSSPYTVPLIEALRSAPVAAANEAVGTNAAKLAAGGRMLDNLVQSAVSHAGRMAVQVGAHGRTRTKLAFYEPGKCCQRCAVLIGKTVGMHENFKRHPQCDGQVVEYPADDPMPVDPMDPADVTDLTVAQRKAIEDGADFGQVVNAKRGRAIGAGGLTTSAGTRGFKGARLTPKGIYVIVGDDREKARQLLIEHRYLRPAQ